jgi:chemotaxis methyl-accepting protein methylase
MQHQTHTTTHLNRYPKIFNYVANNFLHLKNILSFGCSSGEECFTLKEYFKGSNIYGVDTNSDALNKALKNNNEKSISFSKSLDEVPMVDCIFAMSVFCKWPETDGLIKNNI